MFFQCCYAEEPETENTKTKISTGPSKLCDSVITPVLLHASKSNWACLATMMRLRSNDLLKAWFTARKNIEARRSQPSFELVAVALWINDLEYLETLTAQTNGDLTAYIATRNNEEDCFGRTLWHYAKNSQGDDFILNAQTLNVIPKDKSIAKSYVKVSNRDILTLHQTLYSGDFLAIEACLKKTTQKIPNTFQALAMNGCWQGLLICIVNGTCDPFTTHLFDYFEKCSDAELFCKAVEHWDRLVTATRSWVEGRERLRDLIESPEYPELCFAYLVFRFMQHDFGRVIDGVLQITNNKLFYGQLINEFLYRQKPQPAVLELLCFCPKGVIAALNPDIKAELRIDLHEFYPEWAEYLCHADEAPRQEGSQIAIRQRLLSDYAC